MTIEEFRQLVDELGLTIDNDNGRAATAYSDGGKGMGYDSGLDGGPATICLLDSDGMPSSQRAEDIETARYAWSCDWDHYLSAQ